MLSKPASSSPGTAWSAAPQSRRLQPPWLGAASLCCALVASRWLPSLPSGSATPPAVALGQASAADSCTASSGHASAWLAASAGLVWRCHTALRLRCCRALDRACLAAREASARSCALLKFQVLTAASPAGSNPARRLLSWPRTLVQQSKAKPLSVPAPCLTEQLQSLSPIA